MRKSLVLLFLLFFGMAGVAIATPVTFDINGASESYVNITEKSTIGDTTIFATLNSGLATMADFTLLDDHEKVIDFFDFSVTGSGLGDFGLEANLSFATPEVDAGSTGSGFWGTLLGTASAGIFNWDNATFLRTLSDGNIVQIALDDGLAIGCGDTVTVHATITNLGGAPVPEPATLLLLGSGLAGLAFYRRKRK